MLLLLLPTAPGVAIEVDNGKVVTIGIDVEIVAKNDIDDIMSGNVDVAVGDVKDVSVDDLDVIAGDADVDDLGINKTNVELTLMLIMQTGTCKGGTATSTKGNNGCCLHTTTC